MGGPGRPAPRTGSPGACLWSGAVPWCLGSRRSEGASAVRNGSAHTRPAPPVAPPPAASQTDRKGDGIGAGSMRLSQRRPLAFEVPVAGAHRVAVDALGCDALAPSAQGRVVDAQYDGAGRHEHGGQQRQRFSVPPTPLKEQRRERGDHRGEAGRHAGHGDVSGRGRVTLTHRPLRRPSHRPGQPEMAKVEISVRLGTHVQRPSRRVSSMVEAA